ncbi:hypothetical protein D3P06_17515 [Paracoccus aestuarii]|uniref:Uncharacterized protein n=2 Tax=Paracoccus aestuarii TaxID=453842 RepID=A0A418ZPW0_9RHOB|nr:hypothetical protein [Paracoccus aestuarii]RJK96609.1 hypothetical protein D3P06_17515 [Paracoccus aestuarii]WCR00099.1 hypothetical protein JHW48_05195 [Paracoccus aestuarii]
MPGRSNGSRKRFPGAQRAIQFAEVVDLGADHGWQELTVPQIMAAAFRLGINLPSERVVRISLDAAVGAGLIASSSRGTYGKSRQRAA